MTSLSVECIYTIELVFLLQRSVTGFSYCANTRNWEILMIYMKSTLQINDITTMLMISGGKIEMKST